jgi:heme/copper-type cytochrome/quinol oxidase subunit 2
MKLSFFKKKTDRLEQYDISFDSIMLQDDDLNFGTHRLYEVDNRLVLPMGVPIRFVVTSTDVLHSWALPSFGLKVDAIPGRLNQHITIIKRPGTFYGQCSELCGAYHGFMPIVLDIIPFDTFLNYVTSYYNNYKIDLDI